MAEKQQVASNEATLEGAQKASQAMAENQREAERKQLDEVEPGKSAVYIVNGQKVGPNGQPIQDDGTEAKPPQGWVS